MERSSRVLQYALGKCEFYKIKVAKARIISSVRWHFRRLYIGQGCGVGVGGFACFQLETESVFKTAGVGVGFQNCWSRSRFSKLLESESVFKTAGVGVGFQNCWSRSRFFKTVRVETFVAITDSNVY